MNQKTTVLVLGLALALVATLALAPVLNGEMVGAKNSKLVFGDNKNNQQYGSNYNSQARVKNSYNNDQSNYQK
jgi:hypothetical protein